MIGKTVLFFPVLLVGCQGVEFFVAGYGGLNVPSEEDVLFRTPAGDALVELDPSGGGTAGGRVGVWAKTGIAIQPGFAVDVSHSANELGGGFDFEATAISFLGFARLVLPADDPQGWQPYIAIGPSIYLADVERESAFFPLSDSDTTVALDFRAGMSVEALRFDASALSFFAEYRLTRAVPEFSQGLLSAEVEALTHYALFGVAVSFGK